VAGLVVSLLSANGVFTRMATAVSSENYKVNATMMTYYFNARYQSFLSNYSAYLSSSSLDKTASLKTQNVDPKNQFDAMLLQYEFGMDTYTGTWYDLFMDQTVEDVSEILIYCEEADKREITLSDEELEEIETALDQIEENVASSGYTLAGVYGEGVKRSDIKKALRYSNLASKCATAIAEDLEAAIKDADVNSKYASDPDKFDVVNFYTYSLSTSYSEIKSNMFDSSATTTLTDEQKAKILEAYNAKVEELKAMAETLKGCADAEAFKKAVVEYHTADSYEDLYKAALKAANEAAKKANKDAADITVPSEDDLKAIKAAMVAEVVAAVLADKDEIEDAVKIEKDYKETTIKVYEKTVSVEFAKVLNTTKQDLFESVHYEYENLEQEKVTKDSIFSTKDGKEATAEDKETNAYKLAEWLFGKDTQKLTTNSFEEAPDADAKDEDKKYTVDAFLLTETRRKDEEKTRDVAYLVFQDKLLAADAIKDLQKETAMDLKKFEKYADEKNVEFVSIENYMKGTMGSSAFDEWLFGAETKAGSITPEALNVSSYYYMVALYVGEGNAYWYESVKDAIFAESSENYQAEMEKTYKVTVNEKALSKIGA